VRNIIAYSLPRDKAMSSEWTLDISSFRWICSLCPFPEIDLFTTRENHQLPRYCSPILDSQAVRMDDFLEDWTRWSCLYLFPPSQMILKALRKLEDFKGSVFFIVPFWPNQPWIPMLQSGAKRCLMIPNPVLQI